MWAGLARLGLGLCEEWDAAAAAADPGVAALLVVAAVAAAGGWAHRSLGGCGPRYRGG